MYNIIATNTTLPATPNPSNTTPSRNTQEAEEHGDQVTNTTTTGEEEESTSDAFNELLSLYRHAHPSQIEVVPPPMVAQSHDQQGISLGDGPDGQEDRTVEVGGYVCCVLCMLC